jgi:hypothetical protein
MAFCRLISDPKCCVSRTTHHQPRNARVCTTKPAPNRIRCEEQLGPAARSCRQKAEILARFKERNARSAPSFLLCVGMALVNSNSARKFSSREVGGPAHCSAPALRAATAASGSRGAKAGGRWHGFGLPLPSFSRWVLGSNH